MLKEFLKNLRNRIRLSDLWPETKTYIQDTINMGEITTVLEKEKEKWLSCPKGMPPEYCSKENIKVTYLVRTSMGHTFVIKQICYGLNFEDNPDAWRYLIYNDHNELLVDSDNPNQERKLTTN